MLTLKSPLALKFLFIVAFVIIVICCTLLYSENTRINLKYRPIYGNNETLDTVPGYMVFTPGCKVPYLDTWDPMILKYVADDTSIVCNNPRFQHQLLDSTHTHLSVKRVEALGQEREIRCCYREFRRRKTNSTNVDFEEPEFNRTCVNFENRTMESEEFIQVECTNSKNITLFDTYAFVPLKTKVEERCKTYEGDSSRDRKQHEVSVLILGVDSLSKLHMYRQMQRTRKILNAMEAIELKVHNTLDMFTQPNLVPLLTGFSRKKFRNRCIGDFDTLSDDCPFIWKRYERAGYRTAYGEDESIMNVFNIQGINGFHEQPTDYYIRPFMMVAEKLIGNKDLSCVGNRTTWSALLNYVEKFVKTMGKRKYFGFFWCSSLCHQELNYAHLGDKDYKNFLNTYKESTFSNSTVLIFMSDHGKREHRILDTYQGRIELRNPFVYFVFPNWMKKEYKSAFKNFERNAEHLTSHFDVHETLRDLKNLTQLSDINIELRSQVVGKKLTYGRSLFLPISDSRTCSDIGVADRWCMCQQTSTEENIEDPRFYAQVIIDHLNNLLQPHRQCAKLKLRDVITAVTEIPRLSYNKEFEDGVKDYHLVISVLPSNIILNATVRHHLANTKYMHALPRKIEVKNYTGQNRGCVHNIYLEPYCYCK